jgi:hypothetical protein
MVFGTMTLSINSSQHKDTQYNTHHNDADCNSKNVPLQFSSAAECHSDVYRYSECHGPILWLSLPLERKSY